MIYSLAFLLLTHFLAYFLAFLFLTTTTTFLLTTFILTYFHSRSRLARNGQPTNQAALNSIVMIVGCPLCCSSLQHLNSLLENYLEPLKKETFLSSAEISALFGNIQEIVAFQRLFLDSLEQALALEPNFDYLEQPFQFKVLACHLVAVSLGDDEIIFFCPQNILFAVGSAFLFHANNFKLYSSFCASHSKAQKVLLPSKWDSSVTRVLPEA